MRLLLGCVLWLLLAPLRATGLEPTRVEPPHWWVGMRQGTLQLMLYGQDLGRLSARILHPGVRLSATRRGDSPNYLFLDLEIDPQARPGPVRIDLVSDTKLLGSFEYRLKQRQAGSRQRQGFGPGDLIYLLVPDRFANGDPSNDVLPGLREARVDRSDPGARHGGDLAGMTSALDYLQQLGVTQLWPTPLVENDMPAYSYHGYAATDLYRVDPRFGGNQAYLAFSAAARQRGIGVIQDIVLNHIGSRHPWLADPPTRDWIHFAGVFSPTNHARTTLQDPYAAEVDRRQFSQGWFVDSMPDLNQRQPLLAEYLIQNSIWWIEEAGLSGIREDTYSYADPDFLAEWGRRIRAEYPDFSMVGEEWSRNPLIVSYWQAGNAARGYRSHTPSMMDFPLYYALLDALSGDAGQGGWLRVYEALANDAIYPAPEQLVLFEGNHDTARLFSLLDEDLGAWKQAMVFLLTTRRVPQVFYGSEVLLSSPKQRDDGLLRRDFPGGWPADAVHAMRGEGLSAQQREAQQFFRRLATFRRESPALRAGALVHFLPQQEVYVYVRRHPQQTVLVVLGRNSETVELDLARFAEALPAERRGTDVISGQPVRLGSRLQLPANGLRVLALP